MRVDVERAMTPAPENEIHEWLAELQVITVRTREDDVTTALKVKAYTARLSNYPADMVKAVLLGWRGKYWPTWGELADDLDRRGTSRNAMLSRLRWACVATDEKEVREPITAESKARVQKMVAEFVERARPTRPPHLGPS